MLSEVIVTSISILWWFLVRFARIEHIRGTRVTLSDSATGPSFAYCVDYTKYRRQYINETQYPRSLMSRRYF